MPKVGIHPPKTPVTKGSMGIAKATTPNVCKMPGPPAPFVPSPLPNIAKSGMSPRGYSKTVKIENNAVAIRGASFESMGDMASKGTGGGLISANTHGPAKFITPGSLTVKIEGKSVYLLGEPMLNNCGPSGNPPNTGATMMGVKQGSATGSDPCSHPDIRVDQKNREDAMEAAQQRVNEAEQNVEQAQRNLADAQAALEAGYIRGGPRRSTLRNNVSRAQNRLAAAEAYHGDQERALQSLQAEQQVADDTGGGNISYLFVCNICGNQLGEIDVLTADGKAKEVKQSEGGFRSNQFDSEVEFVEQQGQLGAGLRVEVAIVNENSTQICENIERDNPQTSGRTQAH